MEDCVANQTLKDKSCLVPCNGLYADTVDESLKNDIAAFEQYMQTGLQSLIEDMKAASLSLRRAKIDVPRLAFFDSSRRKEDGMKKLPIEEYIGYKKNFLKRVQFDP